MGAMQAGRFTMRRFVIIVGCAVTVLATSALGRNTGADEIIGEWLTDKNEAVVEIYKCGDLYCGKIVWLKEPTNPDGTDKLDTENPDPSKRGRPIVGLVMVWDFRYHGNGRWVDGRIYDPDNGKTYSCKMDLEDDTLKVRGYIGISLFGRTTVWTRKH
jgi:uncharacterized protein (DUF2147 family)